MHLKKILALVLAFACAFTMFAGAAFTDQADIKATDAVNMLSSLGVITGYTDGSYQPNKVVTRAEMAKMIFVVRNNKIDDSAYQSNYSKLTDISNHWAKGYIKFCESQGIIAGKGNNKFDPDSPVTGVEAAKMLLVVSGYDSDKAGLTGSAWRTNVLKYAGAAGILDDVNSALEQGLPRQYAAQMIYNTLDVNRVKWSEDSKSFDDILNGGVKETVGSAYMGLSYDYGTLTAIEKDSLYIALDDSYDTDNYHNSDRNYKDGASIKFTKVSEDYTSLLGQKVKVMFKDGKTNNVLGVYAIADNTVYTTLMNGVEKDGDKIKFDGKSYSIDKKVALTFVGVNGVSTDTVAYTWFDKGTAHTEYTKTGVSITGNTSLSEVSFVDSDADGKIDTAIVFEKIGGKVNNVSSDKINFAGTSYKFEDENIDKEIKTDDYAVMSYNMYGDCKNIVKANVVTDTFNGSKDKDKTYKKYQIADTWYNIAINDDSGYDDVTVGDTVKAYVYNGVILNADTDDGNGGLPTNVAVVIGNGGSTTLYGDQVKLRYFDGTVKTVTIDTDAKNSIAGKDTQLGRAYKVSGSDSKAKLEELESTTDNGSTVGKKYNGYQTQLWGVYNSKTGSKAVDLNASTIAGKKVADDAVIIVYTANGSSKTITGKQFNNLTTGVDTAIGAKTVFTKKTNGLDRVRVAAVQASDKLSDVNGKSNDNYAYITADAVKKANGDISYTIWNGSENLTVLEENGTASDRAKGTVIGYSTVDSNKYIQDVDDSYGKIEDVTNTTPSKTNIAVGANEASDAKFIAVNGNKLNVTSDTKVLVVDSSEDDDAIGISYTYGDVLKKAQKDTNGDFINNVAYILDQALQADDTDLELLVIDVNGKFDWEDKGTTTTPTTEKADYTTAFAAVKVADKDLVTAAASDRNANDNTVTVVLTVAKGATVKDAKGVTATKNGVPVQVNGTLSGNLYTFTIAGATATDKIVVTVADGAFQAASK